MGISMAYSGKTLSFSLKTFALILCLANAYASDLKSEEEYTNFPRDPRIIFMFQPNYTIDLNETCLAVTSTIEALQADGLKLEFITPLRKYVVFKEQFKGASCPYHMLRTSLLSMDPVGDDTVKRSNFSLDVFSKALEGMFRDIVADFSNNP